MNLHTPAALNRRGGNGPYIIESNGLQNTGTKSNGVRQPVELPEFLEADEIGALIRFAPNPVARLCMNIQWRAGLTVVEVLAVTPSDVHLAANPPELRVRQGKGSKDRTVPIHRHLGHSLLNAIAMWKQPAGDPLIGATPRRVWAWYKDALNRCYEFGAIPEGKPCDTHTLRHSSARHWLLNGVPINVVSKWLGHSNLSATMIYAELVSDPGGFMEQVP